MGGGGQCKGPEVSRSWLRSRSGQRAADGARAVQAARTLGRAVWEQGGQSSQRFLPGEKDAVRVPWGGVTMGKADGSDSKEEGLCESQSGRSKGPGVQPGFIRHSPAAWLA